MNNPLQIDGIDFLEFTGPDQAFLDQKLSSLGMQKVAQHSNKKIFLYRQNDIQFVLNVEKNTFADSFQQMHGPSICSMGLRVLNAQKAYAQAIERGARAVPNSVPKTWDLPSIYGIGDSIIYFVDKYVEITTSPQNPKTEVGVFSDYQFQNAEHFPKGDGLLRIDHLTNNVPKGEMKKWQDFYEKIFGFKEIRYFDIRGKKTGLLSMAMASPCGKFAIPINEPTDEKSQIQEYLNEYKGSGIQHIAFLTPKITESVQALTKRGVQFLAPPVDSYYDLIPSRGFKLKESIQELKRLAILADGDESGYLLQLFTQNQVGPIFIELIQREGHKGFGEGNFQALFDAMEADQQRRGVI